MDDVSRNKELYRSPLAECLSLFDDQFAISELNRDLEQDEHKNTTILTSVRDAISQVFENETDENDYKLVVQLDDELKSELDRGTIKLVSNDAGEVFAQLREANGHFGQKLPIKKELEERGVSPNELQLALQMESIKKQLDSMITSLRVIEVQIHYVIQGQHNDRLALFYSGLNLYAESRAIRNPGLKEQVVAQALKSLSDSNSQMMQEFRVNMDFLMSGAYKREKQATKSIRDHLTVIQECFDVIYRASFLRFAIYQQMGEPEAMLTTMEEYSRFVEKMILPYTGKLNELDSKTAFFEESSWNKIASTSGALSQLKRRLCSQKTFYLSWEDSSNGK